MKQFILLIALGLSIQCTAQVYYPGRHHTTSHGGYYAGSTNSHHKGGHYVNPKTGNHYGKHKR